MTWSLPNYSQDDFLVTMLTTTAISPSSITTRVISRQNLFGRRYFLMSSPRASWVLAKRSFVVSTVLVIFLVFLSIYCKASPVALAPTITRSLTSIMRSSLLSIYSSFLSNVSKASISSTLMDYLSESSWSFLSRTSSTLCRGVPCMSTWSEMASGGR